MSIDFRIRDFLSPIEIWKLHRTLDKNQWLPHEDLQELIDLGHGFALSLRSGGGLKGLQRPFELVPFGPGDVQLPTDAGLVRRPAIEVAGPPQEGHRRHVQGGAGPVLLVAGEVHRHRPAGEAWVRLGDHSTS